MSLFLFEGAAGTGKTTRLFASAQKYLQDHPLSEGQKVLALTKYHGSRQRLTSRLTGSGGLGVPVDCMTLDSFALTLAQRWRGLVKHLGLVPQQADFKAIASAAARVLEVAAGTWVASCFPLVLVDEMQDCSDADIELLAGLQPHVTILAGADGFQDLNGGAENEALTWASGLAEITQLTRVHRTNRPGLLDAAQALRSGGPLCLEKLPGFEIVPVRSAPLGGAMASWRIKSWSSFGQIAIITPVRRAKSRFIDRLTIWMGANAAKSKWGAPAGPYQLRWEDSDEVAAERFLAKIGLAEKTQIAVSCRELQAVGIASAIPELEEWARRQRFLKGRDVVTAEEVSVEVLQIVRRRRAFIGHHKGRRHALTVHQAKNREFESVIVFWPLEVRKDIEQQRRLLYNAITRAKLNVIVIVDDPKGNRLQAPPFTTSV